MKKSQSPGICTNCGSGVAKNSRSILSHLSSCYGGKPSVNQTLDDSMLLLIQGKYAPQYWLVLRAKVNIPIKKIDKFLRDYWLECCGHMSEFSDAHSKIGMTRLVSQAFFQTIQIGYVYDFGSSTELTISALEVIQSNGKKEIELLFHNKEIEYHCSSCEKKADALCPYCINEGTGLLCEECATTHPCVQDEGDDILMPIVNSPRAGVCGYMGSTTSQIKKYFPKDIL